MKKTQHLLVLFGLLFLLSNPIFARELNSFDKKIVGNWLSPVLRGFINADWVFSNDGKFVYTSLTNYGMMKVFGNFKVSDDGESITMSHMKLEKIESIITFPTMIPAETYKLYWEDDNLLDLTQLSFSQATFLDEGQTKTILSRVVPQQQSKAATILNSKALIKQFQKSKAATTLNSKALIEQIQNSTMKQCPSHTVQQIIKGTMDSTSWGAGKSADGEVFVQVKGQVNSHKEQYKMTLQFKVQDNSFSLNAVKVNSEVSVNTETLNMIIKNLCERL